MCKFVNGMPFMFTLKTKRSKKIVENEIVLLHSSFLHIYIEKKAPKCFQAYRWRLRWKSKGLKKIVKNQIVLLHSSRLHIYTFTQEKRALWKHSIFSLSAKIENPPLCQLKYNPLKKKVWIQLQYQETARLPFTQFFQINVSKFFFWLRMDP